jgi:hypothetical protein
MIEILITRLYSCTGTVIIWYQTRLFYRLFQGCGSGLDPDSVTLWIRIRIGNPDPDPEARKFYLTQILISKKFEREIVFKSSVLAWIRIRNWIRIRIEQECWIRIRIKSIRIHNPAWKYKKRKLFRDKVLYRYRYWSCISPKALICSIY